MITETKKARLLALLKKQYVTPIDALDRCGIFSLAQRVSEFRRDGMTILDRWVETSVGSRVKSYRLVKENQ